MPSSHSTKQNDQNCPEHSSPPVPPDLVLHLADEEFVVHVLDALVPRAMRPASFLIASELTRPISVTTPCEELTSMSPALISVLAISFDLDLRADHHVVDPAPNRPLARPSDRSPHRARRPSATRSSPASRRASSVSTTPVRYTTPSRVSTSTCRAFTLSLASSDAWTTDVIPESVCRVSFGTIEEAHPTSASTPTPTNEPATTTNPRFMRCRPFPNMAPT